MRSLKKWLLDYRAYTALGLLLWCVLVWTVGPMLGMTGVGARLLVIGFFILVWIGFIAVKTYMARRASNRIGEMFSVMAESATLNATPDKRPELDQLKKRLLTAVTKIKSSKLGHLSGRAALYELPWYIILGNPAAGKSSAIINSGLDFPFGDSDGKVIQGVGGTRNCDWFFTTEGILLDTAGRYSVYLEDRQEWLGFLGLLKKYRPRVPVNGVIVAVAVPELTQSSPDFAVNLAKQLRQRIQELTEQLSVFLPVYVVFTKTDLISGFVEFFGEIEPGERDRVWGATMPYEQAEAFDALEAFETHFDELYDGLREMATDRMAQQRGQNQSPSLLTFPLEFLAVKPVIARFMGTLFGDNPYQFRPILRGFYFTSALQEGTALSNSAHRIIDRFHLSGEAPKTESVISKGGFFLRDLFSRIIFADRNLVQQYASPRRQRLRMAGFASGLVILAFALGFWGWSFVGNQQLIQSVRADVDAAVKIQDAQQDLNSSLRALVILQDRLEQLEKYRDDHPLSLGMGLYQGERIEAELRKEYFAGVKRLMLDPVRDNLETYLTQVASGQVSLAPPASAAKPEPEGHELVRLVGSVAPAEETETASENAYNALKTYLMLADRERIETGHLSDQITRYWRSWLDTNRGNSSQENMIRYAEKIIGYYLTQVSHPDVPLIENKLTLVENTREVLRGAVRGLPARDRVYAQIKARANTRFPSMTVARVLGDQDKTIIAGSYAIPGAFTRAAWEGYIQKAFLEAAEKQLDNTDWVLRTRYKDDLTLEGSPELLQKEFLRMYKAEYVKEWKRFVQGVTVQEFGTINEATQFLGRLGDAQHSPLNKLLVAIHRETSWDNPSSINEGIKAAKGSLWGWFKQNVLRIHGDSQPRAQDQIYQAATSETGSTGVIGSEFASIASLVVQKGDGKEGVNLMKGYLDALTRLRGRFATILNASDVGPGSLSLMRATVEGNGSELTDALRYVDETMLAGMNESGKETVRPLLVRPLMQAFSAVLRPTQDELNRVWRAQVHDPFTRGIATKYPFADSRVEASPGEIAQVFGPEGAISTFVKDSLGSLVIRRGDTIAPRTWANMGVTLNPDFANNVPRYVMQLGAAGGGSNSAAADGEINFQIQPIPTPGMSEIVVEIDGQTLRYRNGPQDWSMFKWPNAVTNPGTRVYGVTLDGQTVEVANFPGRFGLHKLISEASKTKLGDGLFNLSWAKGNVKIALNMRMISGSTSGGGSPAPNSTANLRHLKLPAWVAGAQAAESTNP